MRAFANSNAVAAKFAGWLGLDRVDWVDYHIADEAALAGPALERHTLFHLALVGSLNPEKGQSDAIVAMGKLVATGHDVHLHFYGTGGRGYTACLRVRAAALGVTARIAFCSHVANVSAHEA